MKGRLTVKTKDRNFHLREEELVITLRGVEHTPVDDEGAYVMLFEKKTAINTGKVQSGRTAFRSPG